MIEVSVIVEIQKELELLHFYNSRTLQRLLEEKPSERDEESLYHAYRVKKYIEDTETLINQNIDYDEFS